MRTLKEIEYSYIGCIFDNPHERIVEAMNAGTRLEWFTDPTCRLIWAAIESLQKKKRSGKIKSLLIIQEANALTLRKTSEFYSQQITSDFIDETRKFRASAEEGESQTIESYAAQLRTSYRGRALEKAMEKAKSSLNSSSDTSTPGLELARQINTILSDEGAEADINVSDLLDGMTAAYNKAYEEFAIKKNYNYIPGIPYPWDRVSHLTKGLNPGLHIVAARPSVGKTSYVLQCILFWCSLGYKVAFNCLDMSVTEMIKRPVSNLAFVSSGRMEMGRWMPDEGLKVKQATETIREYYNKGLLTVTYETDVDKFKSWCMIRHASGRLDIAVIDFAQKFRNKNGDPDEYKAVTYASTVLKEIANELLIPVILLSQLSRDNVKAKEGPRPPELSDLRGSGALEQDATSVVLLHRESAILTAWEATPPWQLLPQCTDEHVEEEIKGSLSPVRWTLAKNQNGATGVVPFIVYQFCSRWYMGDYKGKTNVEKYARILADWRFNEEPFLSAQKNDGVCYPEYWPEKCAILCGQMGIDIPSSIFPQVSNFGYERWKKTIAERKERMAKSESKKDSSPPNSNTSAPPFDNRAKNVVNYEQPTAQQETPPPPMRDYKSEIAESGTMDTPAMPTEQPDWDDMPF